MQPDKESQRYYLLRLTAVKLAVVCLLLPLLLTVLVSADIQYAPENVYQREHSLVKPYQGGGMVSNGSLAQQT